MRYKRFGKNYILGGGGWISEVKVRFKIFRENFIRQILNLFISAQILEETLKNV